MDYSEAPGRRLPGTRADRGILLNSARDFLYVIFRRKWTIFVCFVLIAAMVTAITFCLPSVYESEAKLLIRIGRENLPGDASIRDTMVNVTQDRMPEVKSELAILTSRYLAEQLVDAVGEGWILDREGERREALPIEGSAPRGGIRRLPGKAVRLCKETLIAVGLTDRLTPRMEAVEEIGESLTVDVEDQTNIVTIALESKNAALAQLLLEKLVEFYKTRHIEVFATKASPEFFGVQADRLREELAVWEEKLDAFRRTHGISDIAAQKQTLLTQISSFEVEVSDAGAQVRGLQAKVDALREHVAARHKTLELSRTTGMPNAAADTLKERLLDLRIRELDLADRYEADYRPLVELRGRIERLEKQLDDEPLTRTEVTTGLDQNTESLEHAYETESANLAAARARLEAVEEEVARSKEALASLSAREMEHIRLARNQDLAEREYRDYRENLQQAEVATALENDQVTNVSIVQPASAPLAPIRPRKLLNVALGLLLGLFGGVVAAFVFEFFDDSLSTTEAVEDRLGVPVLTAISESELKKCT